MEAHNTHEIFFRKITRNKMNEFLSISTKYLENQINQKLKEYRAITKLNINNCKNVYIECKDKNQNKIGHIISFK